MNDEGKEIKTAAPSLIERARAEAKRVQGEKREGQEGRLLAEKKRHQEACGRIGVDPERLEADNFSLSTTLFVLELEGQREVYPTVFDKTTGPRKTGNANTPYQNYIVANGEPSPVRISVESGGFFSLGFSSKTLEDRRFVQAPGLFTADDLGGGAEPLSVLSYQEDDEVYGGVDEKTVRWAKSLPKGLEGSELRMGVVKPGINNWEGWDSFVLENVKGKE